ncbi:MAG: alpha/beta hydrolase [Alphaproteobacteria bacterium]|nr:alpha/beta hydrolase [Alphaproteobacteria bacterium]MBV9371714.1 alpha/beta hydrolase [Alphaproteobacteria bacterium]MBV9902490.1 alpha/beta hydrolase [Alphaproteobacteria bacterium]
MPPSLRLLLTAAILVAIPAGGATGPIRDRLFPVDQGWPEPGAWKGPAPAQIAFRTGDGRELHSWLWRGRSDRLIVFFHGNGGNQTIAAHWIEPLAAGGDTVLVASYAGYGGNPGKPSEKMLVADGEAALDYAKGLGFSPEQTVLVGYSLGAAVALELASRREVAGVVTIGAFTSLRDLVPGAVRWMVTDRFDNVAAVKSLTVPVVLFQGDSDEVVPYRQGCRLYLSASGAKRFVTMRGTPHRPDMERLAPYLQRAAAALRERRIEAIDFADPGGDEPIGCRRSSN